MTWTATTLTLKDAAGTNQSIIAYTDGTNYSLAHPILDNTGAIIAPATQGTLASVLSTLQASLALPTGASTAANQATGNTALATIATAVQAATPAGTNSLGTVGLNTGGNAIGSITNTAFGITGALPAGANAIGQVTANAGTNLNTSALALDTSINGILVAQSSTTSGQKGALVLAAVSTAAPTLTTGQTSPLSLDPAGNLRVNVVAGGAAGGGTSSSFAAAFPATGTALGAKNGANMVNLTADASSNLNVNVAAALPAGANVIGAVNLDIGGTSISASNPVYIADAYLAPAAVNWNSSTALNTAQTSNTSGMDTVIVSFVPTGSITAGVIVFEVFDGAAWLQIKAARIESYNTEGAYALTGTTRGWQIPVAGFPQFRIRLSTAITGTGSAAITTIISSAPDTSVVTVGIDPASVVPLPTGASTAANQATEITSLAAIQTSVSNIPASPATAALQTTINTTLGTIVTNTTGAATAANQTTQNTTLGSILTATQSATPAGTNSIGNLGTVSAVTAITNALPAGANTVGNVGLVAGSAKVGIVTTDQTTHGTTDLVAADITKVGGAAFALGQQLAASALPVVLTATQLTALTPLTTIAVTQATGTNLHTVIDSGTITTVAAVTAITNALPAGANLIGKMTPNDGTSSITIKAASTAAVATDTAQVSALSPNTPLPAGSNVLGGVTVADGSDVTVGAKADTSATTDTGTFSLIALFKRLLASTTTLIAACQAATPAGTNLIGKMGFDQTTPGTTNNVFLSSTRIVTGNTTTRSANVTAYAAGQIVNAGTLVYPTIAAAIANDVAGTILRVRLQKSGTVLTNGNFKVHLYNAQPTASNVDGGIWLTTTTGYVGSFDVTMTQSFTDGAMGIGVPSSGSGISFKPATGTQNLYYLIEARAPYTPANAEVFTPILELAQ